MITASHRVNRRTNAHRSNSFKPFLFPSLVYIPNSRPRVALSLVAVEQRRVLSMTPLGSAFHFSCAYLLSRGALFPQRKGVLVVAKIRF